MIKSPLCAGSLQPKPHFRSGAPRPPRLQYRPTAGSGAEDTSPGAGVRPVISDAWETPGGRTWVTRQVTTASLDLEFQSRSCDRWWVTRVRDHCLTGPSKWEGTAGYFQTLWEHVHRELREESSHNAKGGSRGLAPWEQNTQYKCGTPGVKPDSTRVTQVPRCSIAAASTLHPERKRTC